MYNECVCVCVCTLDKDSFDKAFGYLQTLYIKDIKYTSYIVLSKRIALQCTNGIKLYIFSACVYMYVRVKIRIYKCYRHIELVY